MNRYNELGVLYKGGTSFGNLFFSSNEELIRKRNKTDFHAGVSTDKIQEGAIVSTVYYFDLYWKTEEYDKNGKQIWEFVGTTDFDGHNSFTTSPKLLSDNKATSIDSIKVLTSRLLD